MLWRAVELVGQHQHDAEARIGLAALDAAEQVGTDPTAARKLGAREAELLAPRA